MSSESINSRHLVIAGALPKSVVLPTKTETEILLEEQVQSALAAHDENQEFVAMLADINHAFTDLIRGSVISRIGWYGSENTPTNKLRRQIAILKRSKTTSQVSRWTFIDVGPGKIPNKVVSKFTTKYHTPVNDLRAVIQTDQLSIERTANSYNRFNLKFRLQDNTLRTVTLKYQQFPHTLNSADYQEFKTVFGQAGLGVHWLLPGDYQDYSIILGTAVPFIHAYAFRPGKYGRLARVTFQHNPQRAGLTEVRDTFFGQQLPYSSSQEVITPDIYLRMISLMAHLIPVAQQPHLARS